jgi:integrase
VAAMTGLRRGELLALRWTDIDLDAGAMSVARSLVVAVDQTVTEGLPKSGRGRAVALDSSTVAALRAHRKRQLEERLGRSLD